jgi:Kef-type K+ transport system membrane component KefB
VIAEASVAELLVGLTAICVVAWIGGAAAVRLRQPRVVGQILAGIALGPSVLGAVWPAAAAWLFPEDLLGPLAAIAQLGLVLFMFLVGAELDLGHLRGEGRRAVVISQVGIVVPLFLGVVLGVVVHDRFGEGAGRLGFALFLGAAMAITAFPVLASILRESGLLARPVGALAMTCAAIDDATAWLLLAAVVAIVEASGVVEAVVTVALFAAYVAAMWGVVRPVLRRHPELPLPVCIALALGSAWVTEVIGVHAIFGAFLAGAVLPRGRPVAAVHRIEPLVVNLLLPVFFVMAGLSTRFGLLDSWAVVALTVGVVAVAVVGKLGGVSVAARVVGMRSVDAIGVGVMMNARGLTEIVILTIGLELGVIGERVFSAMVVMALVTTLMTRPALDLLRRRGLGAPEPALPGE